MKTQTKTTNKETYSKTQPEDPPNTKKIINVTKRTSRNKTQRNGTFRKNLMKQITAKERTKQKPHDATNQLENET